MHCPATGIFGVGFFMCWACPLEFGELFLFFRGLDRSAKGKSFMEVNHICSTLEPLVGVEFFRVLVKTFRKS